MTRQNPIADLRSDAVGSPLFPSFQKEMQRLFDQFRAGFPMPDTTGPSLFSGAGFPAIDVVDTDDAIEISAEIPGVKEDDIDASISGEVLTLKGEKSSEREERDDNYHMFERQYGSFRRQIPLGFAPDTDAVEARFENGVLNLRIVKPDDPKNGPHKIDIKTS